MVLHPAEIPIRAILAALPQHARISGLWVQTAADGTLDRSRGPVHVSVQWRIGGDAMAEGADGPTVAAASQALLARLHQRFSPRP